MNPDVLIVGSGPAGLSAALSLKTAGARVLVVDEQPAVGGQVYRAIDRINQERPQTLELYGQDYKKGLGLTRQFSDSGIEVSFSTSVWDISFVDKAPAIGLLTGDQASYLRPRHLILATGAMERPTPFPGWTLPGVMTVGAAQTLFKSSAMLPESPPVIAGTGPLVYLFVIQMLAAGIKPALVLDTGPESIPISSWLDLIEAAVTNFPALYKGWSWQREIQKAGIQRLTEITALEASGEARLQSLAYQHKGRRFEVNTDLLLVHDGVIPNNHLAIAAGCEHKWHPVQRYWQPVLDDQGLSTQPEISIVGDSAGIAGADSAACSGRVVGWQVARHLGIVGQSRVRQETADDKQKIRRFLELRRFLDNHYQPLEAFQTPLDDNIIICRCEQVSVGQIREVAALGCMGPNQAKAFTRCGMGACMGRQCGNTVSQLFAKFHERNVGDIGHYRIRPPVRPLTLKQLSNLDLGGK